MGSNSMEGGEGGHDEEGIRRVWVVNQDRLSLMQQKMSDPPKLLTKAAGKDTCCIFRVPQSFVEINGKSYQPHIISIGPYHRGEPALQMIEEHKWSYLGSMLSRTHHKGIHLEDLFKAIHPLEMKARECYSETIRLDTHEFLEMMIVDGCFIIELFRKVGNLAPFEDNDPIVTMAWIMPFFCRDLLGLENQLPYFILQCLFDLTTMPIVPATATATAGDDQHQSSSNNHIQGPSLSFLALNFFNYSTQRPDHIIYRQSDLQARHLLDLVRTSYIQEFERSRRGRQSMTHPPPDNSTPSHVIHCVSKLRQAGIELRQGNADSFLVVNFRHGVIEMPTIIIDDFMSSFLLNCVAFEQCHNSASNSKHFTAYATLLDYLVNTSRDVGYLCHKNIIENNFGTEADIARFINNMGKEVAFDIDICYLSKLFSDVHKYYKNSWHVQWASFKYTYFNTPWSFISAFAGLVLLLLTIAQTFYTIYGVYKV